MEAIMTIEKPSEEFDKAMDKVMSKATGVIMPDLKPLQESTLRLSTLRVSTLRLAEEVTPSMLKGDTQVMLRKGYRNFTENITFAGYPAIVDSVKHCLLEACPLEVLQNDGFEDVAKAIEGMKRHYPDITDKSPITIVEFHLV
jgi:hypothetical protein